MRHIMRVVSALALGALFALSAETALAHGGTEVTVDPLTLKSGDSITVNGEALGANSTVEVVLTGNGARVYLGEVQVDSEGDFSQTFALPADLRPGTYQLQAAGTESATTQVTLVGTGGESSSTDVTPILRERPLSESVPLVVLFGMLAAFGLFFARFTRRPHGRESA